MQVREDGRGHDLDAMYEKWPFFKVTMDMIAMVLAKGDDTIVSLYENKLVESDLHGVGDSLRSSFALAKNSVLSIVGDSSVLGSGTLPSQASATSCATSGHILDTYQLVSLIL